MIPVGIILVGLGVGLSAPLPGAGNTAEPKEPGPSKQEVSAWIRDLESKNPEMREAAANELAYAGEKGKDAVPALARTLKDQERKVRIAAARTLYEMGPAARPAIPTLLEALTGKDDEVWEVAFTVLRRLLGPSDEAAAPPLVQLLQHTERNRRWAARKLLARLGPAAVPVLSERLKDKEFPARQEVIETLGEIGPAARTAAPVLAEMIVQKDELRPAAVRALVAVGPGEEQVSVLLATLNDPDADVRKQVAQDLARGSPPLTAAAGMLLRAQRDPDEGGVSDKASAPLLAKVLENPDAEVRKWAAISLAHLGPDAQPAAAALRKALVDSDAAVRLWSALALLHIEERAETPIPVLIASLKDEDADLRFRAAQALGTTGHDQVGAAIPPLIEALADDDPSVRLRASLTLSRIGPAAVPGLTKALKDSNRDVRVRVMECLGRIGPAAKPAVPDLLIALQDRDELVRLIAGMALKKIDPEAAARAGVR